MQKMLKKKDVEDHIKYIIPESCFYNVAFITFVKSKIS